MKYLHILICLLFALSINAQKINKDYILYPQENGNLYFIFPQKGFTSLDKTDIKGFEYDITYLTAGDSLTFSYTYINKEACKSESVSFLSPDNQVIYKGEAQMLFVQPQKKNWKHRATIKVPYDKATQFYNQESPSQLLIHTNKGRDIQYQITDSKWEKQRYLINRVFEIIANNK